MLKKTQNVLQIEIPRDPSVSLRPCIGNALLFPMLQVPNVHQLSFLRYPLCYVARSTQLFIIM